MPDFGVDVVDRLADVFDPAAPVASQVLDAGPDDCERRPQLMAGVGRELALPLQRNLPPIDRFTDRDQRAARIQIAGQQGGQKSSHATAYEHHQEQAEEVRLLRPIGYGLEDEDVAVAILNGLGEYPERSAQAW